MFIFIEGIVIIIISIFVTINIFSRQKYRVKGKSIIDKQNKEKYLNSYPEKDLEREIRIISNKFKKFEESNRYTYRLVRKANKDRKMKYIRKLDLKNIRIIKYTNKKLVAVLEYNNYSMMMDFKTVTSGRMFLKNYKII